MNKKHTVQRVVGLSSQLVALVVAICLGAIAFSFTFVSAASLYVAPSTEVAIRRGQGTEYKIVAMVKNGEKLEALEELEGYTRVRLDSGREGWVLSRFLSPDPPLDQVVDTLQSEKDRLVEKSTTATRTIEELTVDLRTAQEELANLRGERNVLSQDYKTLQRDTADVVQIKQDMERTAKENSALLEKLAVVEEQYNTLKNDSNMYWFLVGAGVLVVGIILGKLPAPSRRRKSSLL